MKIIQPKRLKAGDTIGLIAPGSSISDEQYENCIRNIESLGLKIKEGKHLRASYGYVAGTDAQRLEDLHAMFSDDSVNGIWSARGGYGCTRLLPDLDFKLIRKNPKVLIGYSDITALSNSIFQETGLVGFHGPIGASDFTEYSVRHLKLGLMEGAPFTVKRLDKTANGGLVSPKPIVAGKMRGRLAGGNLSLLAAMAGTPFQLEAKGKIVFLEDVGEKPYRIDRLLTQLIQSSRLEQAAGIILGDFVDCDPGSKYNSLSLEETFKDRLGSLGVPVTYLLSIGHISDMCTLPIGIVASLDTVVGDLLVGI